MNSRIETHKKIDQSLCGRPVYVDTNRCVVEMKTEENMAADEHGLIHGGFIFGLADYAAMLAVNHPNVVLGGATVKFLKPSRTGDTLTAEAIVSSEDGKKKIVSVKVTEGDDTVFTGEFTCFVPLKHVMEP